MDELIYATKEEPHVIVEHEVHVDMQVLEDATLKQEEGQAFVFV